MLSRVLYNLRKLFDRRGSEVFESAPVRPGGGPRGRPLLLVVLAVVPLVGVGALSFLSLQAQREMSRALNALVQKVDQMDVRLSDQERVSKIMEQRMDNAMTRDELSAVLTETVTRVMKEMDSRTSSRIEEVNSRVSRIESATVTALETIKADLEERLKSEIRAQKEAEKEPRPVTLEEKLGVEFHDIPRNSVQGGAPRVWSVEGREKSEKEGRLDLLSRVGLTLQQMTVGTSPDAQNPVGEALAEVSRAMVEEVLGSKTYERRNKPIGTFITERSSLLEGHVDAREGLPVGSVIEGVLESGMVSVETGNIVRVLVNKDVVYKGMKIIPKGSTFVGYAYPDFKGGVMKAEITKLVMENVEVPVNATLLDKNGRHGLVSKYIDPAQVANDRATIPMIAATILGALARRETAVITAGNVTRVLEGAKEVQDALMKGASEYLQRYADLIAQSAAKREPIIVVNAGTPVSVMLLEKLPLSAIPDREF